MLRPLPRHNICGSGYPLPIEAVFGASAHPPQARPYGLTRPVVPPTGLSFLGIIPPLRLTKLGLSEAALAYLQPLCNSAMPVRGLTVDWKGKPRASTAFCRFRGGEQRRRLDNVKVFHKIYMSRLIDSRSLRPRPFFSPCGLVHDTSN